ncbi:MAG: phosphate ABC transporter permease subunit PstC [Candidatus Heimdallarchaeota archaeon]|nr:phosphate ABC transporter permease subunit PstC [Candidatus Heimdallarchaeota archaeon]
MGWQEIALLITASISVIIVILIFVFIFLNGFQIIPDYGLFNFLFGDVWRPRSGLYGILCAIVATIQVVVVALVIAVPISLSTAIYLAEIAPDMVRKIMKPTVELLASIPSVVFGLFGYYTFVPLIKWAFGLKTGETALSGGIILAIMIIPTIVSISDDAISAIPQTYREGSMALGATKWQTVRKVIVPSAISGITAAIILAMGRAIGETMAVLMVAGGSPRVPEPFFNILVSVIPMTAMVAKELPEAAQGSTQYHALFGVAIVLFLITFLVNLMGDLIAQRQLKKLRGEAAT